MAEDDDDDWGDRPPPVTAVAIRMEEAAVEAVRELATPEGLTPAELMRRWVLERLQAELEPPPPPKKKAAPRKKAATKRS